MMWLVTDPHPLDPHPLDPLTADEIRQAAAIVRRDRAVGEAWRFASIELKEPVKAAPVKAAPATPGREALVVCWNRADGQAYRAVVSLTSATLAQWEHLPGQQPNMTADEWHECDEMLRAHPALEQALARRGITDMSRVLTDMWAYGAALVPERYRACDWAGPTSGTGPARMAIPTPIMSLACTRSST